MNRINSTHVSNFNRLNRLFMQRYERYLPTAFDESMSMLEKLNKVIEFIGVITEHLNNQSNEIENWQKDLLKNLNLTLDEYEAELGRIKKEYEDFREMIINDLLPESVTNKMEQWLSDGTIYDLINEVVFGNINDRLEQLEIRVDSRSVNLKEYGAVGDGVADDSQALADALEDLKNMGGGKLEIPGERFYTEGTFDVSSNITIEGVEGQTVFTRQSQTQMFRVNGKFTEETPIIQNSLIGDHFVTVNDPTKFKIGDYIRVVSQRNALSPDAGDEFYLGHPTSSRHAVYFGEYRRISGLNLNTGQLFFRGGLMFPDYLTHNNYETSEVARRNATVDKAEFVENVRFKNLTFDGRFSNTIRFDTATNCYAENVHAVNMYQGDFITFHNSYNCEARHCTLSYTPDYNSSNHYSRNGFKTVSSDNCGFDSVEVYHGTQAVDFTYTTSDSVLSIVNTNSYLTNSKIRQPLFHATTSHPGCLNVLVSNNIMSGVRQHGIFSRGRKALIINNIVTRASGFYTEGTFYGIGVTHDSSINCIVEGNSVDGFEIGVRTHDNVNTEIGKLNLLIANNTITRANRGIQLRRNRGSTFNGNSNVIIRGNTITEFVGEYGKMIDIYDRYFNIFIEDNFFEINDALNGGIYTRGDASKIFIHRNKFSGDVSSFRLLWFLSVSAGDIPSRRFSFIDNITDALRLNDTNLHTANLTNTQSDARYSHIQPNVTNEHSLGTPSFRWRYLYSMNAPDVVSDERLKDNIENEQFGLDIVKHLRPVTYTMENDAETKHGLIAQEVEKVIKDGSVVRQPDGESEYYSMQYEQLIPIIIKAIQELNDKIE